MLKEEQRVINQETISIALRGIVNTEENPKVRPTFFPQRPGSQNLTHPSLFVLVSILI